MFIATALLALGCAQGIPDPPSQALRDHATLSREKLSPEELKAEVTAAIEDGTKWLLDNQREDGSWGSHHTARPIEVFATPPGTRDAWRVAVTGIAAMALWDSTARNAETDAAADRAVDYLIEHWNVRRVSMVEHYNCWTFGYALQALGERLLDAPDDPRAEAIKAACAGIIEKLQRYQVIDGGWSYLSLIPVRTHPPSFTSMSFTTATILVGLDRAARAGVEVPERMLEHALRSIERCRLPNGAYSYGELWNRNPSMGLSNHAGAACRVPLCQYALERFGRELEETDHLRGLENLAIKELRMQILGLRRPIPHTGHYAISGYFYLYGFAYAGYVLEERDEETQRRFAPHMARAVLYCREPDGSFWDYPLYRYHKPYGTAFAVMTLSRLKL